jgi:cytochrome c oxidase accessory protein FixG
MSPIEKLSDDFRDKVATIGKKGRRVWVYPSKPIGRFYRARSIISWFLMAFLFIAPFLKINNKPILLFDILGRKFIIFGLTFWPQDMFIFVLAAITAVVFILLFTAVLGRLFCGWICPQTIFMEMLFRKIEYLIEGSGFQQKDLNNSPVNAGKLIKKTVKHSIFFGLSFLIANIFLSYIIGIDKLWVIVTAPPAEHLAGLIAITIFSGLFYFVFSNFREQACTMVCPYGRLQSVLLDSNSLIVAYDESRGEPREKYHKNKTWDKSGHCIDCSGCVRVCPTGIDIRNGTQLECIHCTACIDACDRVMDGLKLPRGLIKYTSQNILEKEIKFRITPRITVYSVLFSILISVVSFFIFSRSDVEATILRAPGTLYEESTDGVISNLYSIRVINKTSDDIPISLNLKQPFGEIQIIGGEVIAPGDNGAESVFFVKIPQSNLVSPNSLIEIEVVGGNESIKTVRTSFVGPNGTGR